MNELFKAVIAAMAIGSTIVLLLVVGVNIAHRDIETNCDRHASFYIGDTRYTCKQESRSDG